MKILFASMPFEGHFNPLTGIAMYFKERGHDVRWYCSKSYEKKLSDLNIPFYPFKRAKEVNSQNLHQLFPAISRLKGPKAIKYNFERIFLDNIDNHFMDIKDIFETAFQFDIFFCDAAMYALQMIAEVIQKPVYVIGPAPLLATSKDTPPNFVGFTPAKTVFGKKAHQLMRYVMDKMVLREGVKVYNGMRKSHGLSPLNDSFWNISHQFSTLYFQSGVPEFAYYRSDLSPKIKFVGALLPYKKAIGSNFKYTDKLTQYEKVILISQGTVDNKDQHKLIIPALEALKRSPYLLIVTTGHFNTEELRKSYQQPNIIIEDFIDYDFILKHTDLYITNGGYGGVMLSLGYGVPILCAGITEGKNDINAHVRYFKVGIDLKTEKPAPAAIKKGTERIFGDNTIKNNVKNLQKVLSAYHPNELIENHIMKEPESLVPQTAPDLS